MYIWVWRHMITHSSLGRVKVNAPLPLPTLSHWFVGPFNLSWQNVILFGRIWSSIYCQLVMLSAVNVLPLISCQLYLNLLYIFVWVVSKYELGHNIIHSYRYISPATMITLCSFHMCCSMLTICVMLTICHVHILYSPQTPQRFVAWNNIKLNLFHTIS